MESLLPKVKNRPLHTFNNYIQQIRFPFFKQLKSGATIDLDFPFITLVGPNGSGKSSTLQALYGCPATYNVAHYWFSTAIDPIEESGGEPYRYIYKYKPRENQTPVEIAQKRVRRQDDPDYWETARPMIRDGMSPMPEPYDDSLSELRNKTRWKKMQKEVVYIDFRAELSAFDKFFYFGTYTRRGSITSKQEFLRKRSGVLKKHIAQISVSNTAKTWHGRTTKKVDTLSETEINWVNKILGKNYVTAKIVEHDLFNNAGYSIIFTQSNSSYSEAVAGSGEISVVHCVVKVLRAAEGSLILLDEPEVSLHPGAQKALRELLFHAILNTSCQVIMSTHSEHFVQGLPNNAIKLFQYEEATSTYSIINNCSAEQAFLRLGSELHGTKRKIYVEDILAKELVIEAVKEIDREILNNIEVIAYPGGADTIINNLLVHFTASESPNNDIVFLDGDMRKSVCTEEIGRFNSELNAERYVLQKTRADIPATEHPNIDQILLSQTGRGGSSFVLPLNGGNADNSAQALEFKLSMLDMYHKKFKFMSIDTPEELVWEVATGDELFNIDAIKDRFSSEAYKQKFRLLSEREYDQNTNSNQIFELQKRFLARRDVNDPLWQQFKESVRLLLAVEEIVSGAIA
ncbi:AAA family ATPase [Shewanella psychropiezotolerans]|uniref:AAA family ATPase n=1 Tax=Shewanella psychropiezotolerans TaxID=2593655 RepID=A0ABX5WXI2_9GAMM|nr:AAA family ATPase [Shewanella psychropiezotolerans]QDO82423.1 AAA family ATPase [Shewanella psychropiezotolerans]